MKCSILHLIFVIIFGSLADGFSIPKLTVKVGKPKGIQFSLQEDADIISDIRIFIIFHNSVINNSKFVESQLTRNDNGFWIYDDADTEVNFNVEYWLLVEQSDVGYYMNGVVKVQDIERSSLSPTPTTTTTTTQKPTRCEASVTTVNGKPVECKDSIIFYDDFNSDNLNYWSADTRFPLDTADAEFCVYEKRPETSFIRDSKLVIKSELLTTVAGFDDTRIRIGNYNLNERCTPISTDDRECERQGNFGYILPPVTSAYITTRSKFTFMYGKVEVRCRVPVGDYVYGQIILEPVLRTVSNSSEHLKVLFVRGNEKLKDGDDEIGGERVYGGAILSKNPKNNGKWLKSKIFPAQHLGNDFHKYELLWTPTEISLFIDGISYGSLNSNLRESAMAAKIKSAVNWGNNGPFDKEQFLSLMVSAGSVKNFFSLNSTLLNGVNQVPKPWNDTDPRAERSFYMARETWYPTWKRPTMEIDYIKIYSV